MGIAATTITKSIPYYILYKAFSPSPLLHRALLLFNFMSCLLNGGAISRLMIGIGIT